MTSVDWTSAPEASSPEPLYDGGGPDWRPELVRAVVLRADRVRGGDLLVMPERVVVLNGRAASIVRLCDGTRTVRDIIDELGREYPGAPLAADVPAFIDRLRGEGWLR
jgi:pyrroloquinoline quinone biosynthesis protein D